ncbi:MAG: trypsin-like serine protease [Polyangiaceae bacterium]|nr:trypsin-like serine protease [Polyangiaceae bacterium]
MKKLTRAFASFGTLTLLAACASSEPAEFDRVSTSVEAIQGGEKDGVNFYRSSMSVCTGPAGTTPSSCRVTCSATLIAPNVVLTARHCLFKFPTTGINCARDAFGERETPDNQVFFGTGNSEQVGSGNWYEPSKVVTPLSTSLCGSDLAIVVLKRNVPAAEAAPAEPVVANFPYATASAERLTAIGFGETSGATTDTGIRHVRRGLFFVCLPGKLECEKDKASFVENEFTINGSGCPGDSGGGIFSEDSFKAGTSAKQFGVLVRALSLNGQCLDNVYIRLDHYGKLIVDTAKAAAVTGNYEAPAWTKTSLDTVIPGGPNYPRGEVGSPCNAPEECSSGQCISVDGALSYRCSTPCKSDSECSANFRCAAAPDGFCFEKPVEPPSIVVPEEEGGCSFHLPQKEGLTRSSSLMGLLAIGLIATRRRQR